MTADIQRGFPEYTKKSRFPKAQPKGICRGCRNPITDKRRQTWCGDACQQKFHPFYVKQAVRKRCGEKCEKCGMDCSHEARRIYKQTYPQRPDYQKDCGLGYPYDYKAFCSHPLFKAWEKDMKAWKNSGPFPEYDHIIPHSENGLYVAENIRMLCRGCHLSRTADWWKTKRQPVNASAESETPPPAATPQQPPPAIVASPSRELPGQPQQERESQ